MPSLEALLQGGHEVAGVFTQPDRPKGRGNSLAASPVKEAALRFGLPIYQPERIRRPEGLELLKALAPEIGVVVGYGQIIPQNIIDLPRLGILNVHASLLPKYRGAAPIQWAIANGESVTGVTIMRIDAGLDTGDMLLKAETPIRTGETAPELSVRLAAIGSGLLLQAMEELLQGTARLEKQDHAEATLAPILKREDGAIDWTRPAQVIANRLRGFTPWPGAYTLFRNQQLSLIRVAPAAEELPHAAPGTLIRRKRQMFAACGRGTWLELLEVQPAAKKRMTAEAFGNGYQLAESEHLGDAS